MLKKVLQDQGQTWERAGHAWEQFLATFSQSAPASGNV